VLHLKSHAFLAPGFPNFCFRENAYRIVQTSSPHIPPPLYRPPTIVCTSTPQDYWRRPSACSFFWSIVDLCRVVYTSVCAVCSTLVSDCDPLYLFWVVCGRSRSFPVLVVLDKLPPCLLDLLPAWLNFNSWCFHLSPSVSRPRPPLSPLNLSAGLSLFDSFPAVSLFVGPIFPS